MSFMHEMLEAAPSLHRVVDHAFNKSAFYRAKLQGAGITPDDVWSPRDLPKLPLTERAELQQGPWTLLADDKRNIVQTHASTGTTGNKPTYVFFNWEDVAVRGLLPFTTNPLCPKLGIARGEIVVNALPYEVSVTGHGIHRALQDGIGACVVSVGKGGFYADPRKILRVIADLAPHHLFTTPSFAVQLAELSASMVASGALSEQWRPRSIWLIGEGCSQALRARIERAWGSSARLYYGSMESGPIGVECSHKSGFHIAENHTCAEILPIQGLAREDLPGFGELVVTNLSRLASPLIRYRTEDLVYVDDTPCPCGLAGPRLRVLGRRQDVIELGGRHRFVSEIEQLLLSIDGVPALFKLRLDGDKLTLLFYGEPNPEIAQAAVGAVESTLRVPSQVEWLSLEEPYFSGGKFTRLVRKERT